jgi:hypothetical protein
MVGNPTMALILFAVGFGIVALGYGFALIGQQGTSFVLICLFVPFLWPILIVVAVFTGVIGLIVKFFELTTEGSQRHQVVKAARAAELVQQKALGSWTAFARDLRYNLCEGRTPPVIAQWEIPARQNEAFFFDTRMNYSRYYGTYETAEQWREFADARVLASNQRLMISVQGGAWMEFGYGTVTALIARPEEQTVVMHFTNDTVAPLSLHGASMLAVTVLLIARLYGYDGLLHHPAMAPLDFPTAEDVQPR